MTLDFESTSGAITIVNSGDGEIYVMLQKEQEYNVYTYDNCGVRQLLKSISTEPVSPEAFGATRDLLIQLGRWSDQDEQEQVSLFDFVSTRSFAYLGELASFFQYKEYRGLSFAVEIDDYLDDYFTTRHHHWDSLPYPALIHAGPLVHLIEQYTPPLPNDCNCTILFSVTQDVTPKAPLLDEHKNGYSSTIISESLVEHIDIGSKDKAKWWYDMHTSGPATFEQIQSKTNKVHNRFAIGGTQTQAWLSELRESNMGSKTAEINYTMLCNRPNVGNVAFPEDCACDREIDVEYYYSARMIANATRGNQHNSKEKSNMAQAKLHTAYYEYRGQGVKTGTEPIAAAAAGVASQCDFQITDGFWDNYVDIVATGVKLYVKAKTLGGVSTDSIDFSFRRDTTTIDTTLVGTVEDIANSILSILDSEPDLLDSLSTQLKRIINTLYWSVAECDREDITDNWLGTSGTYTTVLRPNEPLTLSLQSTTRHEFRGKHSWYTHSAIVPDYALSTVLKGGNNNTVTGQNCCSPYIVAGSAKGSKDDATAKARAADPVATYFLGQDKWQYGGSTGKPVIPLEQNLWRFVEWKGVTCDNTGGFPAKQSGKAKLEQTQISLNNLAKTVQINNQSEVPVSYRVLDINGKIIINTTNLPTGVTTLPNSLRAGMYLINFITPNTQFVKRAIIY